MCRTIETQRLILRPWRDSDADSLYEYARDERVGPAAGWPPHTSSEDSLRVIREVLSDNDVFAVTIKGDDTAIGSIGLVNCRTADFEDETEIGYWVGVPFWGQGYIPEAVKAVLKYCFLEREDNRVWCGHYEGNDKSRRVIEKCGFRFAFQRRERVVLLGEERNELFYSITREEWEKL